MSEKDPNSGNTDEKAAQRGKYVQPVTVAEVMERIRVSDKNGEEKLRRLRDEWDSDFLCDQLNKQSVSRVDVVRRTVYDLSWYTDHDADKVLRILEGSELYTRWEGGEKEVRMFVEASKVEDQGHYSVYPEEIDEVIASSEASDDSDGNHDHDLNDNELAKDESNDSSQNVSAVSSGKYTTEYDQKKRSVRRDLFGN